MSATPNRLRVELAERGYDIVVGDGLLAHAQEFIAPLLTSPRVIIVSDTLVGERYGPSLSRALQPNGIRVDEIWVKVGEGSKSFAAFETLMEQLLALKPDRKTTILALGGGVVGDLAGFAASTLLRGVPFIQIPTTLLAQVDSSVGGKTAINAKAGKNLIGSFYQPRLVLADLSTLRTLPPRELRAGYAEVIKYGLIMNEPFYRWCLEHGASVVEGEVKAQQHAVLQSCAMKAQIVAADEREGDKRTWLNFGHTFAHALETETGYGDALNHGEAVAIGMVMACHLSARLGTLPPSVAGELAAHLKKVGLPASPRDIAATWDVDKICVHFAADKKAEGGVLTFVVLDAVGKARVVRNVDAALVRDIVAAALKG